MTVQSKYLLSLREKNPLIHNITNTIVINFVANGLLALGASPIMGQAIEEMEEFSFFCNGLALNIGSINALTLPSMLAASKAANRAGYPVVLDPVGVGISRYRREAVARILDEVKFAAIRGNASEMSYLATGNWGGKGVDVGENQADLAAVAREIALKYQTVAVISGEIDYVSDGQKLAKISNGSALLPRITGSGCLLTAVVDAFLATANLCSEQDKDYFLAAVEAVSFYGICGEVAQESVAENACGHFYMSFLDALAQVCNEGFNKRAKIDYLNA
ncbi:MAG: hydroxyethylthiazole kinase [Cardiobacteriaceae bacterium]|nr:hydroxyethylthiazole kinase [Cardiobacteriaceae bacterium]